MDCEISELKVKIQELSDKLGEEYSEMDEAERLRMLLRIEEEMYDERNQG